MTDMFFYGTLCDRALLDSVVGHGHADCAEAELADHKVFWVEGENFPILVPAPGQTAKGIFCRGLSPSEVARLHYYEAGFDYVTKQLSVHLNGAEHMAEVYFPIPGAWTPGLDWDLSVWQRKYGPALRKVATQIMADFYQGAVPVSPNCQHVLGQRAQAQVSAATDPTPALPGTPHGTTVENVEKATPYDAFFAVEKHSLKVPRFDGHPSQQVERAVFISGDAVSVLPYDPRTDRVLMVEQFRTAPLARGDANPWLLEPVAGGVDEGESFAEAAHREIVEETGRNAEQLLEIGRYYSSPGTLMEFMVSYVGLADLPEPGTWLGGLASENEDIRSHVISYDTLLDWQSAGYLRNGPLLLSVGWLALNRDRLRQAALKDAVGL